MCVYYLSDTPSTRRGYDWRTLVRDEARGKNQVKSNPNSIVNALLTLISHKPGESFIGQVANTVKEWVDRRDVNSGNTVPRRDGGQYGWDSASCATKKAIYLSLISLLATMIQLRLLCSV